MGTVLSYTNFLGKMVTSNQLLLESFFTCLIPITSSGKYCTVFITFTTLNNKGVICSNCIFLFMVLLLLSLMVWVSNSIYVVVPTRPAIPTLSVSFIRFTYKNPIRHISLHYYGRRTHTFWSQRSYHVSRSPNT